ncbi:MAG TPA: RNA polymerase sigma factor [Kofleriaceae bacterium]|nr:RNA polymerase sigma factor [Kofleriaceae bacterium]
MEGKILALVPPASASTAGEPDHGDDEWMLLARHGRPGAFDALVRHHQGRALAVAYRYLGQRELAKDVVQNTFLEIYRRLDAYQPHGKFRAYFHRVLLNQCRMAARSRTIRARFQERLARVDPDDPVGSLPDEQILARERERRVERGLLCLSEKLRAVVVLQFCGDLSQAEIAEALEIKVGTVKSRLSAALVALRAELGGERP